MTQQRVSPVSITSQLPAIPTLSVQGALGQSANLVEVKSSTGSVLASVTSAGAISTVGNLNVNTAGTGTLSLGDGTITKGPGSGFTFNSGLNSLTSIGIGATSLNSEPFRVYLSAATSKTVIRGFTAQTANLTEWQDSAGSVITRVDSAGDLSGHASFAVRSRYLLNTGNTGAYLDYNAVSNSFTILQRVTTSVNLIVKAVASQTANLQEWQNSAGTNLITITASGDLFTPGGSARSARFRYFDGTNATGTYIDTQLVTNSLTMAGRSTTAVTTIIRAAASQTADLQQWQDSAGTVQASISPIGNITSLNSVTGGDIRVVGNVITMRGENSGGKIRFFKSTAAATNPGAGLLELYTRDGTNAGTLKLVVRAGAAGAETTILDNIPQ